MFGLYEYKINYADKSSPKSACTLACSQEMAVRNVQMNKVPKLLRK